jgi:hypothetical protein
MQFSSARDRGCDARRVRASGANSCDRLYTDIRPFRIGSLQSLIRRAISQAERRQAEIQLLSAFLQIYTLIQLQRLSSPIAFINYF